jgi:hypothetical protein
MASDRIRFWGYGGLPIRVSGETRREQPFAFLRIRALMFWVERFHGGVFFLLQIRCNCHLGVNKVRRFGHFCIRST